ncbi:MAG: YggT family protein [Firmicutes bacterium]|nr:YggT family protein [Bacillota bacterium]
MISRYVILKALDLFIYIINILIIGRIILSFIIRDLRNPLLRFVYNLTEPLLAPFRELLNKLPFNTGMFDFSPILAILFLDILRSIVFNILV